MKKRILVVSHAADNRDAGSSRVVHLIKEGLSSDSVRVDIRHNEMPPGTLTTKLYTRFALPKIISALAENPQNYDVIVGFNGTLYPLFRKLKRRTPRPILIEYVHGLSTFDRMAMYREAELGLKAFSWHYRFITGPLTERLPAEWELRAAQVADAVIVQNSRDREFLQRNAVSNISQVALPIVPEIADASKSASPQRRDPERLLWFGSWIDRKGVNYIVDAFVQILAHCPNARLTIGGTGHDKDYIVHQFPESARSNIRVLERISLAKQIDEYGRHSILLFPSLSEGFGFVLLEAMSMGLAVVATLTGFAADHLTPEKHFVAVPMGSAEKLATETVRLIKENNRRGAIATAGQKLAKTFTLESYRRRLFDIIAGAESRYQADQPHLIGPV
jgi:glycosyltransferase involved in cell wall biosynthesis